MRFALRARSPALPRREKQSTGLFFIAASNPSEVATGGIFRLGCGLLALRAAQAFACAPPPRKTVHRTVFLSRLQIPSNTDQKERDPIGPLSFWCDRRDLNPKSGFVPANFQHANTKKAPTLALFWKSSSCTRIRNSGLLTRKWVTKWVLAWR